MNNGQNSQASPVSAARNVTAAKIAMNRQPSCRMGTKKFASMGSVDLGKAEDLTGVDQVGVANLALVGVEDRRIAPAFAVVRAGDIPQIVAAHDMQAAILARLGLLALELKFQDRKSTR